MAMLVLASSVVPCAAQVGTKEPPELSRTALEMLPDATRETLETAYEKVRTQPHDASVAGRLAMMLHAHEQYRLAGAYYERASQLDRRTITWPYLAGVVHAEAGDAGKAQDAFRRALAIDPEYLPARIRLAAALFTSGDLTESRVAYEALVRSFPDLALAHYGFGRVLVAIGDAGAGRRHYETAVKLAPQFGRAHYVLGLAYRDTGVNDKAEYHLNAHRRFGSSVPALIDPLLDEIRSMRGTARELLVKGAKAATAGRVDEAIAWHLEALEVDPTATQAHVNLISIYGRIGRLREAEQHYRSALRLKGNLAEAHYNYGVLQAAAGRYVDATAAFHRALDVDPFHPKAHNNLAALLARQQRYEESAAHYHQALASDPLHHSARFGLGEVLVALKRPREAIQQFEKLLVADAADTPRYRYGLAMACLAAGETARGIAQAEQALEEADRLGQTELAARIARELPRIKAVRR